METIPVRTSERCCMVEITREVREIVRRSAVEEGIVVVQTLHTTGGLTINENADPDVVHDLVRKLGELVPESEPYYRHAEGNSDSHLKTTLGGASVTVLVSEGELVLGRWQGIYFCEWDGPRDRQVAVQVVRSS